MLLKNFSQLSGLSGPIIKNVTSAVASNAAKKLPSAAAQLRDAAFKTWSGKLKDFSPAKLAEQSMQHISKAMAAEAQSLMASVRADFMAGLAKQFSKWQNTAANLSHHPSHGYHHAGPKMAPPGCFQSPWRFNPASQTSNSHWQDSAGVQWQSNLNHRGGSHTSASRRSGQNANGTCHRQVKDHKTGYEGTESYNGKTKQFEITSVLTGPCEEGISRRINIVYKLGAPAGTVWHEAFNERTGDHTSVGEWGQPDLQGNMSRATIDHRTGALSYERFNTFNNHYTPPPSHESSRPGSNEYAPPPQYASHRPDDHQYAPPSMHEAHGTGGPAAAPPPHDEPRPLAGGITKPLPDSDPLEPRAEEAFTALGLASQASYDDAKKAYRKLSMQHHPDKGGDAEAFKYLSVHFNNLKQYMGGT